MLHYGSPSIIHGPVAQWIRAPVFGTGCRGFESLPGRQWYLPMLPTTSHIIRLSLSLWGLFVLLRRLLVAHLQIVNDGSPTPDTAYRIEDITLAQAFYGQLAASTTDYYRFVVPIATTIPLSLLVPENHYRAGFRPVMTLAGPGLPDEGLIMAPADKGRRLGTTTYQRTQQANPTLLPGMYLLAIYSVHPGVYCFCCGTREPTEYADAATRARVQALLELP